MAAESTPAKVRLIDQLGLGAEARWHPQNYFPKELLRSALMEPWEEAMAAKGVCPKCSDSLIRASEDGEIRFSQCMRCSGIFVLKA